MSEHSKDQSSRINNANSHKLLTFEHGLAEIVVKHIKVGELTYADACKMARNGADLFDYEIKGWGSVEDQSKFFTDHHLKIIDFIKAHFGGDDIVDIIFKDVVKADLAETEISFNEVAKGIYEPNGDDGKLSTGREVVALTVIDLLTELVGKDYKAYFEITENANSDAAIGTFFE